MLIGLARETAIQEMLTILQNSEYNFYLTGSRYFGTSRENSDWDFFCQNTPGTRLFLMANGFNALPLINGQTRYGDWYSDKNIAHVFRHNTLAIDIQCQFDVDAKIQAQDIVKALYPYLQGYVQSIHKDQIRNIWNAVYKGLKI